MNRNEVLGAVGIGIFIISTIPAVGLAIAFAKDATTVPLIFREGTILVFVAGGAVVTVRGAVAAASQISKKRRSTFLALCACGEWFIADAISELYFENHSAIEKILFKGSASVAFALAGGLWSTPRWPQRLAASVLFIAPTFLLVLKILSSEMTFTIHGFRLYILLGAPLALAALYIVLFKFDVLKE